MTRPGGDIPRWAYSPSHPGDLIEPSDGRKADGWNPGERPPAQNFNWWMNRVGAWIDHVMELPAWNWQLSLSGAGVSGATDNDILRGLAENADGTIVAVGFPNARSIYRKLAGGGWQAQSPDGGSAGFSDVVYFPAPVDLFVATRYSANNGEYSIDGETWTETTMQDQIHNAIAAGDGKLVAVGPGGNLVRSVNAIAWFLGDSDSSEDLNDVEFGNGLWVLVGDNGELRTSDDAVLWTLQTHAGTEDLRGVAYHERTGLWIVVGDDGRILTSPNGTAWTSRDSNTTENLHSVSVDQGTGLIVAAGHQDGAVTYKGVMLMSKNAVDWYPVYNPAGADTTPIDGRGTQASPIGGIKRVIYAPVNRQWLAVGQEGDDTDQFATIIESLKGL